MNTLSKEQCAIRSLLYVNAQAMSVENRSKEFDAHLSLLREAILNLLKVPVEGFDREPLRSALKGMTKFDTDNNLVTLLSLVDEAVAKYNKHAVPELHDIQAICTKCGLPSRTNNKHCSWCDGKMTFSTKAVAAYKAKLHKDEEARKAAIGIIK